jgi:hypothetical protein
VTECAICESEKLFAHTEEATTIIRLAKNQRSVLAALHRHKHWQRGGGWVWNTNLDETERLLDQLVETGLVVVTQEKLVISGKPSKQAASISQSSPIPGKNTCTEREKANDSSVCSPTL